MPLPDPYLADPSVRRNFEALDRRFDKMGRFPWINVENFGAVANRDTAAARAKNQAAFEAAFASVDPTLDGSATDPGTMSGRLGRVVVPKGFYYMADTLHISRILILEGEGGAGWYPVSVLVFPDSTPGIICESAATSADGGAFGGVIGNIGLRAAGQTSTSAHAIQFKSPGLFEQFDIRGWGGDGIHIDAAYPTQNCNNMTFRKGSIYDCLNGVFVQGNDANQITFDQIDSSYHDKWAFFDNSFLGNYYENCHTSADNLGGGVDGVDGGAYSMGYTAAGVGDQLSASILHKCYAESGNLSRLDQYVMTIQCTFGSGITSGSKAVEMQADNEGLRMRPNIRFLNDLNAKNPEITVGGRGSGTGVLVFDTTDTNSGYTLDYETGGTGRWTLAQGGSGSRIAMTLSGDAAVEGAGYANFPRGYYIATQKVSAGVGTPEGAVTAPVGSLFLRNDGGAGTTLYIKESGAGNTGWVGK